jgi:hypothetical protein
VLCLLTLLPMFYFGMLSPVPKQAAKPLSPLAALEEECDTVAAQFDQALDTRDAIKQRDELQTQLDAVNAADDFRGIARMGRAYEAAVALLLQQLLSEEDYLTLAERHEALVQNVAAQCRALADSKDYDALETLASKLEELKALDVSTLPQAWANDPVLPPVPAVPAATASLSAIATGTASGEDEEEGANDPVYVPPPQTSPGKRN